MLIDVTNQDIVDGETCDNQACPVALAVVRKYNRACFINTSFMRLYGKSPVNTPQAVQDFIFAFDNQLPVEPFTFEVTLD